MVSNVYIPEEGDIVWLDFTPQSGHEQAGRRPGLVVSPKKYNRIGLALICPITSKQKKGILSKYLYPVVMALPLVLSWLTRYEASIGRQEMLLSRKPPVLLWSMVSRIC